MNIQITKRWLLTSDNDNFIVNECSTIKSGDNRGKPFVKAVGYYTTLPAAITGLLNHKLRQSPAESLESLLREHRAFVRHVEEVLNAK